MRVLPRYNHCHDGNLAKIQRRADGLKSINHYQVIIVGIMIINIINTITIITITTRITLMARAGYKDMLGEMEKLIICWLFCGLGNKNY